MEQLNIALAVTAAVVVLIGLLSTLIKKSLLQEPMIATLVGLAVGAHGLGWLDVAAWGDEPVILEHAARLTLAIGLMGVALRLRKDSVRVLLRPVVVLLTLGMAGMWLASAGVLGWMLGLPLWTALLVGAVVTPTDPVVASSIVTGKFAARHLPLRVRDTLSFEAGANDGLAYLLVTAPIAVLTATGAPDWTRFVLEKALLGVAGAAVLGTAVGFVAAKLMNLAMRKGWVENASLLGYTVAFSLLTLGLSALLRMDALIAVFAAGLTFNLAAERSEEHAEEHIQAAVA